MHLMSPDLGASLEPITAARILPEYTDVQILVSDGLSAEAVHYNLGNLLPVVMDGVQAYGWATGAPMLTRYGRVKLAEPLAERLQARLIIYLIGERPGGDAVAARSLSAYLAYRLDPTPQEAAAAFSHNPAIRFEYTVISNIGSQGLPAVEAGSLIVERVAQILKYQAAGNRLESILEQTSHGLSRTPA